MEIAESGCLRFTVWIRLQPALLGRKECRKVGVGGMIRGLKSMIPENGTGEQFRRARADVRLLEAECRLCGRCTKDEIMRAPE